MNEVISKLADAGCDIDKGLETSYDEEELYISSLRQFAEDDTPQKMERAYRSNNIDKCRMYACSFSRVLYNLGISMTAFSPPPKTAARSLAGLSACLSQRKIK